VQDTVRLAQSALDAELRRLSSGMTTSYNVAQAQRDLSQARSRELATYVDLNKAVTQLYFVLGTLDEFLQVSITSE
jgi:outer membrane protein TolC